LISKKYQETIAEGISKGVNAYIKGIDQAYKGG
jgi:hypothetical protein